MTREHLLESRADRAQLGVVKASFAKGRRVTGLQQQGIALTQRYLERFGEPKNHPSAGNRAAVLDEADVPLSRSRAKGQLQLAQPAPVAPSTYRGGEPTTSLLDRHVRLSIASGT